MNKLSPSEYFQQHYKASAIQYQVRAKRRDDLKGVPDELLAQSPQDFCNQIAEHVKSLLFPEEIQVLGDFYFGLIDEPELSSSIEQVGDSYLVLIYRRLFNALQFVSDVICSLSLTDYEKCELIGEYMFLASTSSAHRANLPKGPRYTQKIEWVAASSMNGGLIRYVLCHELCHKLADAHLVMSPPGVDLKDGINIIKYKFANSDWEKEHIADFLGACLPLREKELEDVLADTYFQVSLLTPVIFHCFSQSIEIIRETAGTNSYNDLHGHPPSNIRAALLVELLSALFPKHRGLLTDSYNSAKNIFLTSVQSVLIRQRGEND